MKQKKGFFTSQFTGRQALYNTWGIIESLLLVRLIFKLLVVKAEPVFWLTGPLVAPFGLITKPDKPVVGATFEIHTLVALLVIAFLGFLIASYFAYLDAKKI